MARRKPLGKAEPPSEPQLPMVEGSAREPELHVFPHTLRTGDRLDATAYQGGAIATTVYAPP